MNSLSSMMSGAMSGSTSSTIISADGKERSPSTVTAVSGNRLLSTNRVGNTSPTPVTRGPTWTTRNGYCVPNSSVTSAAPSQNAFAACMSVQL